MSGPNDPAYVALLPLGLDHTDLNDAGNAKLFVGDVLTGYAPHLRFVRGRGWFRFSRSRWRQDEDAALLAMRDSVRRFFATLPDVLDEGCRKTIYRHAQGSLRTERLRAALVQASAHSQLQIAPHELDAEPLLLGVPNGILDLGTGRLLELGDGNPPERTFITLQAGATFDPSAQCPRFERFMEQIFDGDAKLIAYVQTAVGYSLTGLTSAQVIFFLLGGGANGKSVLMGVLRALLGEYFATISADTLLARTQGQHSNDLARFPGKRVAAAIELDEGARWNESLLKNITGGEPITVRMLYREYFEFVPVFKLWIAGNHKPRVRGQDLGIWRRLRVVPFRVTIAESDRDPALLDKLRDELPGILNWAIRGLRIFQAQGLVDPPAVRSATRDYQDDQDLVGEFIAERCSLDPDVRCRAGELYEAFAAWSNARGEEPMSQTAFGRRLDERGLRRQKVGVFSYIGVALQKAVPD